LNTLLPKILPRLLTAGVEIRHQCGKNDETATKKAYMEAGCSPDCVSPFIDNMAEAYAWADMALSRAGASTTAELCAAGLPCVLVPFPHAAHNHQTHNARILEKAGLAVLLPENGLHSESAGNLLLDLFEDETRRRAMSRAALDMARLDAAERVVAVLEETVGGNADKIKR
jgi:UDP-N-acetylglucosamine--N-acetylmuramyl-(pentapeptide) pyrophosphoryl-undecaprenol N-acetylglucosamine transferase